MLTVSALAVYLAVFVPPIFSGSAPPSASVSGHLCRWLLLR